jgi:TfoX/Sxy family transcriptional regulator of competence genes
MAFDEQLSNRIREALTNAGEVEEKLMFGGICYMLNGKMCVGVIKDEMMCRIGPEQHQAALERAGCREMRFSGKPMPGTVFVSEEGMRSGADFEYWISLCRNYNPHAKASKKKRTRTINQ